MRVQQILGRGKAFRRVMNEVAGQRKAQIKMFAEEAKAKRLPVCLMETWGSSRLDPNCHAEEAGAVQSCRPSVSEHWNPQSFFSPRYAEHQQLYMHATLTHHHPSPGRRSGNSSLENLNSPKEKTGTFLVFGFPPSASLPPHLPRVKPANRGNPHIHTNTQSYPSAF